MYDIKHIADIEKDVKTRLEKAKEIAEKFGNIIGFVTRVEPVEITIDKRFISIEIPGISYLNNELNIGDFIGIITTTRHRLILGRVVGIERRHILAEAGVKPSPDILDIVEPGDISGLLTPAKVKVELITECEDFDHCDPSTVYTPIDPASPVIKPNSRYIARLLGLPENGILLGKLFVGGREIDIDVKIPEYALHEHILVVGTTGSGKTVLLKNIALSSVYEIENVSVIIFDLQGDYLHLALPPKDSKNIVYKPIDRLTVVFPITKKFLRDYSKKIIKYAEDRLREEEDEDLSLIDIEDVEKYSRYIMYAISRIFIEKTYPNSRYDIDVEIEKVNNNTCRVHSVNIDLELSNVEFNIRLIPWSLRFSNVMNILPEIFPIFSERVSLIFDRVLSIASECARSEELDKILEAKITIEKKRGEEEVTCVEYATNLLKLHWSQRDNIIRGLNIIRNVGIIDVKWISNEYFGDGKPYIIIFDEPENYRDILDNVVIIDLRLFRENPQAASVVVYRLLSKLFEIKDEDLIRGVEPKPTIILIDEAHNYFPQTGRYGEDISKESVEAMINKLCRLGRVRKIGVIFATHTPEDLNNLILQLTNTKIGLRSDIHVLEKVGLKEYANELIYALDGVGVVKSYVYKTHTITFRSLQPQTYHRSHK